MTDETEVVESEHTADENGMSTSGRKSPLYRDTEVTEDDRTVKFWNRATFSDVSTGNLRRVRFGIDVDGGIAWVPWDEYTSPKEPTIYKPEKEITVPRDGNPEHPYPVKTRYEVDKWSDSEWSSLQRGDVGPHTAKVKEDGGIIP